MLSVNEMRRKLDEYCHGTPSCSLCYLQGDTCRCGRGASFPEGQGMTDDEIVAAYDILVDEGVFDPYNDSPIWIPREIDLTSLFCT